MRCRWLVSFVMLSGLAIAGCGEKGVCVVKENPALSGVDSACKFGGVDAAMGKDECAIEKGTFHPFTEADEPSNGVRGRVTCEGLGYRSCGGGRCTNREAKK